MEAGRRIVTGLESAGVTLAMFAPATWLGASMAEGRRSKNVPAFDPRDPTPLVWERSEEIRVRFASRMEGAAR